MCAGSSEKRPPIVTGRPFEADEDGAVRYFEVTPSGITGGEIKYSIGWVPGSKLGFTKQLGDGGFTMGYHNDGSIPGSGFPDGVSLLVTRVLLCVLHSLPHSLTHSTSRDLACSWAWG